MVPVKNRSTLNYIISIKNEIDVAKKNEQNFGIISLDIAKTCDTTWRPVITLKLNKTVSKDDMLIFIHNFLPDRTFQVKTSNFLPDLFIRENGVPQRSTISITLFLIAINDISDQIPKPINPSSVRRRFYNIVS